MKNTRLWQDPGSPLIRGRSKRRRILWPSWFAAWLLAALGSAMLMRFWLDWRLSFPSVGLAILGAAVGAALGVWLSKFMGDRAMWVLGTVLGVVGGLAAVAGAGFGGA
ncbi:MAG: hypothetical protein HGA39_01265 [Coriobacteriia bacterium]|nr:hypothetical protein [Coriobacteriia bacterium]